MTSVTLIATVRNERSSLDGFLDAILQQTRQPDEIVIADGGSTDGTLEHLEGIAAADSRFIVLSAPGSTISRGRNVAIGRARGPLIAVTDAGAYAEPNWLEQLIAPLESDPTIDVSSGFTVAGGKTWFERTLSTVITPQLIEIDADKFLPSSRSVAFRKEAWSRVGGYPEWLRHCEDLVFDLDLRRSGARFVFTPGAVVSWQARPDLTSFFRQYFNYARGDGHAHLYPRRHAARYIAYAAGTGLIVLSPRLGAARLILTIGLAHHLRRYARRVNRRSVSRPSSERFGALASVPIIVIVGDLAKMFGYPIGLLDRAAGRIRVPSELEGIGRAT